MIGLSAGLIYLKVTNEPLLISPLIISSLSALVPDVDEPKSKLGNKIKLISYPLKIIFGHRTITHSLLGLILISMVGYFFIPFYQFIILGYLSHLIADFISDYGIPIFYPLLKERFYFRIFKTGGIQENIFFLILLILNITMVF